MTLHKKIIICYWSNFSSKSHLQLRGNADASWLYIKTCSSILVRTKICPLQYSGILVWYNVTLPRRQNANSLLWSVYKDIVELSQLWWQHIGGLFNRVDRSSIIEPASLSLVRTLLYFSCASSWCAARSCAVCSQCLGLWLCVLWGMWSWLISNNRSSPYGTPLGTHPTPLKMIQLPWQTKMIPHLVDGEEGGRDNGEDIHSYLLVGTRYPLHNEGMPLYVWDSTGCSVGLSHHERYSSCFKYLDKEV